VPRITDENRDKAEYGDFQTPLELARQICRWLKAKGVRPDVLVEPTFGQGHFILAALETFPSIRDVYVLIPSKRKNNCFLRTN